MISLPAVIAILCTMMLVNASEASPRHASVYPEIILHNELVLNEMITNIHLLQIDFMDHDARDQLKKNSVDLGNFINDLPKRIPNKESTKLLATITSIWPAISQQTTWLASWSTHYTIPEISHILKALTKMDRRMLSLRKMTMIKRAEFYSHLRFQKQALMMQKIIREYLNLIISEKIGAPTVSIKMQLRTLAAKFSKNIDNFKKELATHPHVGKPLRRSHAAWTYIKKSIDNYPDKQVPSLMIRYSNQIINHLISVHKMISKHNSTKPTAFR